MHPPTDKRMKRSFHTSTFRETAHMSAPKLEKNFDTLHLAGERDESEYISMENVTLQLVMDSKSKINIHAIPYRR
jgi:hypothetical protein